MSVVPVLEVADWFQRQGKVHKAEKKEEAIGHNDTFVYRLAEVAAEFKFSAHQKVKVHLYHDRGVDWKLREVYGYDAQGRETNLGYVGLNHTICGSLEALYCFANRLGLKVKERLHNGQSVELWMTDKDIDL